jgi:hypothetical protein
MFTVKRVTSEPNSPLRVVIDRPQGDGDAGLAAEGVFYFFPAGSEDGETEHGMSEFAARVIMGDPGLAPHFECSPELDAPAEAGPTAPRGRRARRESADGGDSPASE